MQETFSLSVSLAHRYYDDSLSEQENKRRFGRSMSSLGLGHNLKVMVTFPSQTSHQKKESILNGLKSRLDHQSFISSGKSSSLEMLVFKEARFLPLEVEILEVQESPTLSVRWRRSSPGDLELAYTQAISVLWREGGGARVNMTFTFRATFDESEQVLVWRSLLEEGFWPHEDFVLSRKVKENQEVMDALFKELQLKLPSLIQIKCELEKGKKWLIHEPFLTR